MIYRKERKIITNQEVFELLNSQLKSAECTEEQVELSTTWIEYLKQAGLTMSNNGQTTALIREIDTFLTNYPGLTFSKLDKLNLVNLLPLTKGDLYLILGDRVF